MKREPLIEIEKKQTNACYINITYILCMYYVVAGASHNNDSVRVICVCQARYSVSGSALFKVKQQILNIKTRISNPSVCDMFISL